MDRKQNKSVSQFGKNVGLGLQCFYIESIYVAVIDLSFSCVAFGYALFIFGGANMKSCGFFGATTMAEITPEFEYRLNAAFIWLCVTML